MRQSELTSGIGPSRHFVATQRLWNRISATPTPALPTRGRVKRSAQDRERRSAIAFIALQELDPVAIEIAREEIAREWLAVHLMIDDRIAAWCERTDPLMLLFKIIDANAQMNVLAGRLIGHVAAVPHDQFQLHRRLLVRRKLTVQPCEL